MTDPTTPNPSRSVSPEPTKGERNGYNEAYGWVNMAWSVMCKVARGEATDDEITDARMLLMRAKTRVMVLKEQTEARESAYIPLVEAARDLMVSAGADTECVMCQGCGGWHSPGCVWSAFERALVQVPGQQQADTEQGGG